MCWPTPSATSKFNLSGKKSSPSSVQTSRVGLTTAERQRGLRKTRQLKELNGQKKDFTILLALMMAGLIVWLVNSLRLSSSTLLPLILCDNFCFLPLKHTYHQLTCQVSPSAAWFKNVCSHGSFVPNTGKKVLIVYSQHFCYSLSKLIFINSSALVCIQIRLVVAKPQVEC